MKTEARAELTLRGLVLGVLITLVFTAANVYFGLKAGLTFATSIPAAVISMAVLRGFKGVTIQENNIVQTVASAAGTLSSVIFVLPGMVMIGWWSGFPYWVSCAICVFGGTLGVMYSIPLRRALLAQKDLPFPEGVACAEVLKVGGGGQAQGVEETRAGLHALLWGSVISGAFSLITATRIFASDVARTFRVGERSVSGFDFFLSFALFGVGHLVGLWVGVAMLVGALIAWVWGIPHFSALSDAAVNLNDPGAVAALARATWSHKVRFVGAGTIGVAAIWTLAKLTRPVAAGLASAMAAARTRAAGNAALLPITEQDMPIGTVGIVSLVCVLLSAVLLAQFVGQSGLGGHFLLLVIAGALYIAVMSFLVSGVCGYMAGLIGASNSPLSGIGILAVVGFGLILVFGMSPGSTPDGGKSLVAYALFVTAVVFAAAAIANNNLQDLKTGQLVDATPWKQQAALVVGVIAGAVIIPPILDLLNHAYGFAGAPGAHEHPLPAPQAGLISALAQGVIQNNVDWSLIETGGAIGVVLIVIDLVLRRAVPGAHCSPLAVGLGIYLPTQSTLMVVVGAVCGWLYDRAAERRTRPEATKQLGVLLASGMIVGEGLVGVLVAALVAFSGQDFPLSLVPDSFADNGAVWLGAIVFTVVIYALYRRVGRALKA
ncbi:MAG TPA: oligopeptide transporter, OPT family [Steroidobacteraceae bacterium]|nr:oligopeptide transporter, OPT family [Steroidobacteraceae bacterium]